MRVGRDYEAFEVMFQSRRALTQVQAIVIVVIVVLAGAGAYLLELIPGISSPLSPGSSTTTTHSTTPLPSTLSPGTTKTLSFMFGDYNRTYSIHIPQIYDSNKLTPLVIMLHGFSADILLAQSYFPTDKSDKEGFIIVYPKGIGLGWNVAFGFGEAYKNNMDDVGFMRELIYRIEQIYKVDSNRIYVTGFSAGAMLAYLLGAELSDEIAAIAPVAGSIGGHANETASPLRIIASPSQPVSVIVFMGTSDPNYYGAKVDIFGFSSLSVHDSVAFWVEHDGCSKIAQNTTGNPVKSVYSNGLKGTEVVLYTLIGGGHEWPSNAADIIWDFFKNHPQQH